MCWIQVVFDCGDGQVQFNQGALVRLSNFFADKISNKSDHDDIIYHYPDFDGKVILAYLGLEKPEWYILPELLRFLTEEEKCAKPGNVSTTTITLRKTYCAWIPKTGYDRNLAEKITRELNYSNWCLKFVWLYKFVNKTVDLCRLLFNCCLS